MKTKLFPTVFLHERLTKSVLNATVSTCGKMMHEIHQSSDTINMPNTSGLSQAWAHEIFIFRTEKIEISGHFSGHQSHKNAFFVISGAYNFRTFRAEAKITIRRHEVVYRQYVK